MGFARLSFFTPRAMLHDHLMFMRRVTPRSRLAEGSTRGSTGGGGALVPAQRAGRAVFVCWGKFASRGGGATRGILPTKAATCVSEATCTRRQSYSRQLVLVTLCLQSAVRATALYARDIGTPRGQSEL